VKKVIAILPMRAGSKRIKNKNTIMVGGKPLYSYVVDSLLASKKVAKIIINSDIKEIDNKYREHDKIVFLQRPKRLRGNCSMNLVIKDTLGRIGGEHFLQTHATNPLLSAGTIDNAVKTYFKKLTQYDSFFSVTKLQKRFWDKKGNPVNHNPKHSPTTQDLEPYFEENSCVYIFSRKSFFKNNNRIGKKPHMFKTSVNESFDIDNIEELKLLNRILKK
jgi:CMP-N-acetylneuraminic acid synthetase